MSHVQTPGEVFDAIQKAKAGAPAYCTNFFPVEAKLQTWINHGELSAEWHDAAALFYRTDRDFRRLYFCAADVAALQRGIAASPGLKNGRVMTDLVGNESALNQLLPALEPAGFRRHTQLQRLARLGRPESIAAGLAATFVEQVDGADVLALLENTFDRYGEQLPTPYEIEAAIENRQILAVKRDGELAGLLHFETQGMASTIRFWAVAEKFRGRQVGSALMQHYFQMHAPVRRFTLWVDAHNENAIQKYRHYGYAPDGLIDHVLAHEKITS